MIHPRLILSILTLCAFPAFADVKLPACFGDHMVLQRDMKIPVWGTAEAGEKVQATLGKETLSATATADGKWRVDFAPLKVGEPLALTVTGKNTVAFKDVLVGEVWLASGQSNMDFTVAKTEKYYFCGTMNEAEEVAAADHPLIRMFTADWTMRAEPQSDVVGTWKVCTPESVREFSAVAYFFARDIQKELGVPVGVLTCTYGASTAQAWISREALAAQAEIKPMLDAIDVAREKFATDANAAAGYERATKRWEETAAKAKADGGKAPRRPKNPDPIQDQHNATVLYNGMIAPIIPYAMRGALWYQGESNTSDARPYPTLQNTLITDWRNRWAQGDFPFYLVQLASNNAPKPEPGNSRLASMREAQGASLKLPNTGMAVTIDIGDEKNVHPKNKQDVGHRLARIALAQTYGKKVEFSGPMLDSAKVEGGTVRVKFTHAAGLTAKGGTLKQFAIAGADKAFVWADAKIEGDSVIVSSATVPAPAYVRYAWADFPEDCNLYNGDGLPAAPFRTDP